MYVRGTSDWNRCPFYQIASKFTALLNVMIMMMMMMVAVHGNAVGEAWVDKIE
jgi:hypothetical protein